jgi:hypothetical protein
MKTQTYHFEVEKTLRRRMTHRDRFSQFVRNIGAGLYLPSGSQLFANNNEITVSFPSLSFAKGGVTITITPGTLSVTVTGVHSIRDLITLSTSNTACSKGNVGTIGIYFIWNHDITNTIQLGGDGTTYPIALFAGEFGFGRWNAATFNAKASAGTPQLEYCLIEA